MIMIVMIYISPCISKFFNRSSILVAKDLLGKYLVRKLKDGRKQKFKIIETECYEGFEDLASHASRGKTLRNAPMFGGAGTIYVYFTYGMHYMLNIVCGPKGHPSAVLIRGLKSGNKNINLIGPARLTKYLKIDKSLNNQKLGKKSGLWVEPPSSLISLGALTSQGKILKTPRIGIFSAGPIWSQKPYRFLLREKSA